MDEAKMMKAKRNNWTRTYHKMLKGLEMIIDMQKQIKEILKIMIEVILIKPYEVDESISMTKFSFINNEVENLIKYMKFI